MSREPPQNTLSIVPSRASYTRLNPLPNTTRPNSRSMPCLRRRLAEAAEVQRQHIDLCVSFSTREFLERSRLRSVRSLDTLESVLAKAHSVSANRVRSLCRAKVKNRGIPHIARGALAGRRRRPASPSRPAGPPRAPTDLRLARESGIRTARDRASRRWSHADPTASFESLNSESPFGFIKRNCRRAPASPPSARTILVVIAT